MTVTVTNKAMVIFTTPFRQCIRFIYMCTPYQAGHMNRKNTTDSSEKLNLSYAKIHVSP